MSADRETSLLELASSVSDGVPVDWKQIESTGSDREVRRRQCSLKTVAIIYELHRQSPSRTEKVDLRLWAGLEIRGKIGSGSFGEVYRAWDPNLRRDVALKLASTGGQRQTAAMKEARALARVRHRSVVTVYGVETQEDQVGLWMELIRGRTLEAIVKEHGPLGDREAALVGVELCGALAAVHAEHLVHGDLKAQNVMREERGRIVLMDFGLVRNAKDATFRQGGTPAYMAPELLRGKGASVQSDIFALGVLLYYLVTDAFPLSEDTRDTGRYAANAALLHDRRPNLNENFVQVIERALSPVPEDRFRSAGAMLKALSVVLGTEHLAAPPQDSASGFFKRPTQLLTLFSLLILAILIIQPGILNSMGDWMKEVATGKRSHASIAVLPFETLSSSPGTEDDYLSESVANDITSRLTKVKALRVVMVDGDALKRLRNRDDVRDIVRELQVKTVLSGSVRKTGDVIRISVQLIDPQTKRIFWKENYERKLASFLGIGPEVSRAVVPELAKQFADMQLPDDPKSPTANPEAYTLYINGRFHWNKRSAEEIKKAIDFFEKAVKVDPVYALAYSGIADCYSTLVDYGHLPAAEGMPKAKTAADRALELDDTLAETQTSVANVKTLYDWDWAAAEARFLQALRLNPSYSLAHTGYARFLAKVAHTDGAIIEARRAVELDPLSLPVNSSLGADLYFAGRYEEARVQLQKTLDLDPPYMPAHFWLGRVYIRQKKYNEALAESVAASAGHDQQLPQLLAAEAHAVFGQREEALNIIHEWEALRAQSSNVAPSSFAVVYSSLHEKELTLEWLNRAYDERDSSLLTAQTHPAFDWLRSDARFQEIFKRMGLPFKSLREPGSPY